MPVWLSLVLHPDHRLRVRGERLNLLLDATVPPGAESFGFRFPEIEVADSELHLVAVQGAAVTARQSVVQLEATSLRVHLTLHGSTVTSERHDGALRIEGQNDEVRLGGHHGSLDLELKDSDVFLQDGEQRLTGDMEGGSVVFGSFKGSASLTGKETRIQMNGAGRDADVAIRGETLDVTVDRFHGDLEAELIGGSFTGDGLVGRITVHGSQQATIDLSDLEKITTVVLRGRSFARVSEANGLVKARLESSELRAQEIKTLGFIATNSQVTVDRATRVDTLTAVDSDLALDLATIDDHPTLLLKGQSRASVRLPAPCMIRSVRRVDAGQIQTVGCEIEQTGAGHRIRSSDVVMLKTSLDPDSYLEVESSARFR